MFSLTKEIERTSYPVDGIGKSFRVAFELAVEIDQPGVHVRNHGLVHLRLKVNSPAPKERLKVGPVSPSFGEPLNELFGYRTFTSGPLENGFH
jgi:hypothetical protein